jgi:hypothetical protein
MSDFRWSKLGGQVLETRQAVAQQASTKMLKIL